MKRDLTIAYYDEAHDRAWLLEHRGRKIYIVARGSYAAMEAAERLLLS